MKLNDNVYDILKWVVILVLPTASTLYAALSAVWGWPLAQEITATITAITAALGALLGISTAEHNKTLGSSTYVNPVTSGPEPSDQAYTDAVYDGTM